MTWLASTTPSSGTRRIEHWSNANYQGGRLGRLLAGEDAPYDTVASFFTEVFGRRLNLLGDLDGGHDEHLMRGSLQEGAILGVYLRDGRLVAAVVHNQDDELQERLRELLRTQAPSATGCRSRTSRRRCSTPLNHPILREIPRTGTLGHGLGR